MQISNEELRKHYASLSDEALRDIRPGDLTDAARKCYEEELKSRQPQRAVETRHEEEEEDIDDDVDVESLDPGEDEPDWLETAECVCSFRHLRSMQGVDGATARDALLSAGVPCHLSLTPAGSSEDDGAQYDEYQLMVPPGVYLKAKSVLDEKLFNAEIEAGLKAHLAALSDEDLQSITPDEICAGLRDLMERLTHAYHDEVARREESGN
jgi:hypothetical protein